MQGTVRATSTKTAAGTESAVRASRSIRRRQAAAVVAVAMLAMCGACEHVPPAPIDAAANGARIMARSLDDPRVTALFARHDLAVAGNGWSLDKLTVAAWALRTDLAVARSEVDAARAATDVARGRPNPAITSPNEKVFDPAGPSPWVVGAALALHFETAGKRAIRTAQALAAERSLEWRFGQDLWLARAAVRKALLDLALAQQVAALDSDVVELTHGFSSWVETRLAHGAATTSERLAAVQAANEALSRSALDAAAIGVTPSELSKIEPSAPPFTDFPAFTAEQLGTARDLALVNRLDVRRALSDYDVAEQGLRAAVAAQYPDITLAPGYLHDQADHKIALGLDLPLPLRRSSSAAIRRAIADRAVAAAKVDDVQAVALAAIDVGFAQYTAARDALSAAESAERDGAAAVATVARRLAAGAANRGELLAAQIAHAGLRRSVLDARRALLDASTALENGIEQPVYPRSSLDAAGAARELLVGAPQ